MKRFEELLCAFENAATDLNSEPGGIEHLGGYKATYIAAHSALIEYVRERMDAGKPTHLPCLRCGRAANPELSFCPMCESEVHR